MAQVESEFQKLLSEAPAAPKADTITVVGALARTPETGHFVLILLDGRSEMLDVAAVKSAKKVAGAIGQSLVEMELDANLVPESVKSLFYKSREDLTGGLADYQLGPWGKNPILEGNNPYTWKEVVEGGGFNPVEAYTPFVAAAPHQAHPGAMASHTHRATPHHILKPPQFDLQVPPKQPAQDGTNPWNSFDITGYGTFDVITYHGGNPIYHY